MTGDPTEQCRYLMRFLVEGKSYARRWYSVDRCGGLLVADCCVGSGAAGVGDCQFCGLMSGGMMCGLVIWWLCGVVAAVWASAGGWSGWMLNRHILAPACSCCPWRMIAPVLSMTLMLVSVKINVHPASQNLPILSRLLVNDGMMWQSLLPGGRFGSRSFACPVDCMLCPLAVLTDMGVPLTLKLEMGALPCR